MPNDGVVGAVVVVGHVVIVVDHDNGDSVFVEVDEADVTESFMSIQAV